MPSIQDNHDLVVGRVELPNGQQFVIEHQRQRIATLEAELRSAHATIIAIQALAKTAIPEDK